MDENLINWSDSSFTLKAFVNRFPKFPHLVQVESGVYNEDDTKTLSAGQILKLHLCKRTDKVLAKATGVDREFFIPVNSACKVEVLPTVCEDVYYSVQDLVDATSVKLFRVVHDSPPTFRLKAGDILEIKKTVEENRGKYIECEFVNKTRDSVKLPLDFKAAFEPLASAEQYNFLDVLNRFSLPIRVRFISSEIMLNDIEMLPLNSVLLKEKREESTIVCTSRTDEGEVTVLMIPMDLDVSVLPAVGALAKDEEYVRICKRIHDGANLEKVDISLINATRLCDDSAEEQIYDYAEVKPRIPPRSPCGSHSGSSYDDVEYYEIPLPPSRPPKPEKLKSPPVKATKPTVLAPKPADYREGNYHKGMKSSLGSPTARKCLDEDVSPPVPPIRTPSRPQQNILPVTTDHDTRKLYHNVLPISPGREHPAIQTAETESQKPGMTMTNERVDQDIHEASSDDDFDDDFNDDDDDDDEYIYMPDPFFDGDAVNNADDSVKSEQGQDSAASPSQPLNPERKKRPKEIIKRFQSFLFSDKTSKGTENSPPPHQSPSTVISDSKDPPYGPAVSSLTSTASGGQGLSADFPDDVSSLSVSEVGECLKKLNLGECVEMFKSKQIDGEMLATLTDESFLTSLGMSNMFDRRKLLKFIHGWRPRF
ncbi:uncharacterized protein [Montipora foliosa]|uniref:uncharacterized protein n=1 Tax=Montipora foliosa TaxID=591990 RepID=UPI0035F1AD39